MIKAIIFDMDGVIFDTEKLWKDELEVLKKKYNIVGITEQVRQDSCGMNKAQQHIFFKPYMPNNLDVTVFTKEWKDLVLKKIESSSLNITKPGFTKIINYIKRLGLKTGLNSGSPRNVISQIFKKSKLDETKIFDTIISGNDVALGKPSPESYLKVCKNLNLRPDECLVLEDSTNGIISALDAGCSVINVLDTIIPPQDIQNKCLCVANSFDEVLLFLKSNLFKSEK